MARNGELRRLRRGAARHADAGRIDEALDYQRRITALAPEDAGEFMQLGFLHRQAEQLDDAASAFHRASGLAPSEADPHEALAEIYLDSARYDEAIAEGKAILKLIPRSLPARLILSSAYVQKGDIGRAQDTLRELVRLAPLDPIGHYKNGVLLQQQGMWRAALEAYKTALQIAPAGSMEEREAESAIESLDKHQLEMIHVLAADDRLFQMRLARNAVEASQERGFFLSRDACRYLQQVALEYPAADALLVPPRLYN